MLYKQYKNWSICLDNQNYDYLHNIYFSQNKCNLQNFHSIGGIWTSDASQLAGEAAMKPTIEKEQNMINTIPRAAYELKMSVKTTNWH